MYTEDLLKLTNMSSVEEAESEGLRENSTVPLTEVTEMLKKLLSSKMSVCG